MDNRNTKNNTNTHGAADNTKSSDKQPNQYTDSKNSKNSK